MSETELAAEVERTFDVIRKVAYGRDKRISLDFSHLGADGKLLNVEFTIPAATPSELGHACFVLLWYCMDKAGDEAEAVLDDIVSRAREQIAKAKE